MKVSVGAATDIGQVREGNEDSFLVVAPLYAVADGMGGHRGGEVASSIALETVQGMFERKEGSLADQVVEANRAVFDRSQNDRSVSGMGTTLTAVLVDGSRVHLVHVGDSRAYLLRGGELAQLTEDHTLVHRMVMEGEISQEEAETHPHRSILTRALGVDQSVQVDETDVETAAGDRLLLCTDGLTGMVPEGQIREILLESADPQEAVEKLVKVANRAGGIDNITAVILDFSEDGSGPGPTKRSGITVVGAPIPEPLAEASTARGPSTSSPAARPAAGTRQEGRDLGGRDARDRRARCGGTPRLPRHAVVRRRLQRPGRDLPRRAHRGRRVRTPLGGGRDLDPGEGGPGPRAVPGPPRRDHGRRSDGRGDDRGEHPRRRRPLRAAHVVSRVAAPRSRTSLAPSIAFTVLALVLSIGAYVIAGYGKRGQLPATFVLYATIFAAGYAGALLAIRAFAPRADPALFPTAAVLVGLGFAMIFRLSGGLAAEQATWIVVGLIAFALTVIVVRDARMLDAYTYTIGLLGLVLLLLPVVPGIGQTINGARLWVQIGPLGFQPAEIGKVLVVIFLASYLTQKRELLQVATSRIGPLRLPPAKHLGPVLLAWGASLAILFLQRDLGASLLYFGIFVVMLWVATGRAAYLVIGLILFVAGAYIGWLLFDHVQLRVDIWLHALDPAKVFDQGFGQLAQAQFGMASGGLVGTGLGQG